MTDVFYVAPHAGAWIETDLLNVMWIIRCVAPHAGAWIETSFENASSYKLNSRSPRGSVD